MGDVACLSMLIIFYFMSDIRYVKDQYNNFHNQSIKEESQGSEKTRSLKLDESNIALKNLKQTDSYIDNIRRRLSLLHIQEQKNQKKARENEKKLQFHTKVREEVDEEMKQKSQYRHKMQRQLQVSKFRIKLDRQRKNDTLKAIKDSFLCNKRSQYMEVKEKSFQIDKNIEKMKEEHKQEKIANRVKINEMEKSQRKNISNYITRKRVNFKQTSQKQGAQYDKQRQQKQALLAQLSLIQKSMIQRQSASRAALDQSQRQLSKIKVKPKLPSEKSTDQSDKLPILSARQNPQYC